jgi:hypothetical protein
MTVLLSPTRLHWLKEPDGDPADLCVHSPVRVEVGGVSLVKPEDGDWTVSTASLYLLRTLVRSHNADSRVGDHLFPCCGFTMYDVGEPDVVICGCPNGADFAVERQGEMVILRQTEGCAHEVRFDDWRRAVCSFSDVVRDFYEQAAPRTPADVEDAKGFKVFLAEWTRRRDLANSPM